MGYLDETGLTTLWGKIKSYVAGATVTSAGTATNAGTASKITASTYGGAAQPVYISGGVPTAISYTISKSVPADANFSNTTYTGASGVTLTGTTFSHTTGAGWNHIPSGGSAGQVLVYSANGVASWGNVSAGGGGITTSQAVDAVSAAGYVTSSGAGNIASAIVSSGGYAVDSNVVHKTGNEVISGTKTFKENVLFTHSGNAYWSGSVLKAVNSASNVSCSLDIMYPTDNTQPFVRLVTTSLNELGGAIQLEQRTSDGNRLAHLLNAYGVTDFPGPVYGLNFRTSSTANPMLQCTWSDVDIAATSRSETGNKLHTCVLDKNGVRFGGIESTANTDGSNELHYTMRNHANDAWLNDYYLKEDASGNTSAIIQHNAEMHGTLTLKRVNPYIYFVETDWSKGTPQTSGTSYQGIYFSGYDAEGGHITYHYDQSKISYMTFTVKNLSTATATGETSLYLVNNNGSGWLRPVTNNNINLGHSSYKWNTVYATTFSGALAGNADTATTAASCTGNAATATKLGTATKGGANQPIYLSAGAPTACNTMVATTGDQTIGGTKTFSAETIKLSANSAHLRKELTQPSSERRVTMGLLDTAISEYACSVTTWWTSDNTGVTLSLRNINDNKTYYSVSLRSHSSTNMFFEPTVAGMYLGRNASGYKWKQLIAETTTINTSDERLKSYISSVPDSVLDAWGDVNWLQFKFNDAISEKGVENARLHTGLIAQHISSIFDEHGLDASRYGLWCLDHWDATPEELDEEGNVITPAREAEDNYALRYEEALCMEAAYQRRRADRAEARISTLEEQIAEIKSLLGAK